MGAGGRYERVRLRIAKKSPSVGWLRLVAVVCGGGALPCEALERRGLRIDAQGHTRRLKLLRYELVDLLCECYNLEKL